uniref:Histone deacetylase domain-containing protein n=1 Tax=Phaeocystis cordata TaxID=118079 RepID=A0A7S1N0B0_9EUKA|mmetsp:Transcript_935/g.1993  ORF Transcript_935/g.1993 Transcript_935/m.1993 type:complete len:364 (+) Transcript_935:7-1098(+)
MARRVLLGWAGSKGHTLYGHPECAGRSEAIEKALAKANLLTPSGSKGLVSQLELRSGGTGEAALAEDLAEKISRVHNPGFVRGLRDLKLDSVIHFDQDTYATSSTYSDLLKSVDVSCRLVDEVVAAGDGLTGFGLVRPPGHHSIPTGPMGFCVFNQISTAVRHAQAAHGLQRIAVIDFDVHHGNGTQDIFYDDPDVLYISTHQQGSFPGTGKVHEVGSGEGEGTTVNVPLPAGSGGQAARVAWDNVIAPCLKRFEPSMIFVSAGFDAHWKDPQASCQFQSSTYYELSKNIKALADDIPSCGGRCVFILEGGYDFDALGDSVAESIRALCGMASDALLDSDALYEEPMKRVEESVEAAVNINNL